MSRFTVEVLSRLARPAGPRLLGVPPVEPDRHLVGDDAGAGLRVAAGWQLA